MSELTIRQATPNDLDALCALESASFSYDQIGRRSFRRLLASPTATVLVCNRDQQLLAYAIILTRRNSRYCRLYSMATSDLARGQGVGMALLSHAMTVFNSRYVGMRLEVKTDNAAGIHLYRKLGFEVTDLLPRYYSDGTDGYRMQHTFK